MVPDPGDRESDPGALSLRTLSLQGDRLGHSEARSPGRQGLQGRRGALAVSPGSTFVFSLFFAPDLTSLHEFSEDDIHTHTVRANPKGLRGFPPNMKKTKLLAPRFVCVTQNVFKTHFSKLKSAPSPTQEKRLPPGRSTNLCHVMKPLMHAERLLAAGRHMDQRLHQERRCRKLSRVF